MAMNLRENKIDKFETNKKSLFFGDGQKLNTSKKVQQKLQQSKQIKKIERPRQNKRVIPPNQKQIQRPQTQSLVQEHINTISNVTESSENIKTEKWIRKKPKDPLPEDKLDYQEDIKYEKEYSQYIKDKPENVLVHWRGPDFEHLSKSKKYYMGISIVIALIILYAAVTGGIIMAFLFALIWIVGYLQLSRPPKVIDFAVTYDGILVGDEMFGFDNIKSFWIFYEPPHTRIISLQITGSLQPYLHIPLHQIDPVIVHEKLVEFIPEEKQEQGVVDIIERLLHM